CIERLNDIARGAYRPLFKRHEGGCLAQDIVRGSCDAVVRAHQYAIDNSKVRPRGIHFALRRLSFFWREISPTTNRPFALAIKNLRRPNTLSNAELHIGVGENTESNISKIELSVLIKSTTETMTNANCGCDDVEETRFVEHV